jgi:flagellar FliL protein
MADYAEDYEEDEQEYEQEYEEGEEEGEEEGSGSKKKLLLVIGIVLVFLIGGAAGAYFAGLFDSLIEGGRKTEDTVGGSDYDTRDGAELFYKDFPDILTNLNEESKKKVGVRIKIVLELRNAEDLLRINLFLPKVHRDIQAFIKDQKVVELQGTEGMQRIREELLTRLNKVFAPSKIKDIYFKEMLVR